MMFIQSDRQWVNWPEPVSEILSPTLGETESMSFVLVAICRMITVTRQRILSHYNVHISERDVIIEDLQYPSPHSFFSLRCICHLVKLCSSVTAYCYESTLRPQGVTMYMLVYTCPPFWALYLAVVWAHVNCCQVLRCLRAQHPLCCSSWLIWVGSTACHSLALACWTCPHGLVRKISPLPAEIRKTQCLL